jgi:uncharacterized protein involved in exopolysaccharide biosynthesis
MSESTSSTSPATPPLSDSLVQVAAKNAASDDLLICTPVDELISQIRKLVSWIWLLRWWLILGTVLGAGCGGLLGITLLRSYTAYSTFRVLTAQHENPLGKFSREAIRFFNSPTNIFPSEALVAKTLERLDQKPPTSTQLYDTRRKLDINDYGGDIYEVSFRDANATRAVDFLRTHIQIYSENEIERNLDTLRREVERIKDTLAAVVERMKRNQESVRAFRAENADGLPEFAREHTQRLRDQEKKIAELEAESLDLVIERSHLQERLKVEPTTIPVETSERREEVDVVDANIAGRQNTAARLGALSLQIAELRSRGLRDAHPHLNRLLIEQDLLTRSPNQVPNEAPATALSPSQPTTVSIPSSIANTLASKRPGSRTLRSPTGNGESTLVENRPNERRTQITDTKAQLVKTRSIVVNLPMLESKYAELNRGQTADVSTYQQVAMVLEMAEFQLKLEQDSAPTRLEQFNLPRLRFSSLMMKVLISSIVGAMVGFALAGLIWSLLSLRKLVWPQGIVQGVAKNTTGPGLP